MRGRDGKFVAERPVAVGSWSAVAVQGAAARLGSGGAQQLGRLSQALPHRICVTHTGSVRPVDGAGSRSSSHSGAEVVRVRSPGR